MELNDSAAILSEIWDITKKPELLYQLKDLRDFGTPSFISLVPWGRCRILTTSIPLPHFMTFSLNVTLLTVLPVFSDQE